MMAPQNPEDAISRLVRIAGRLRINAAAAKLISRLELAGERALVLKGPSIAQ
jgi:hypothetical protein